VQVESSWTHSLKVPGFIQPSSLSSEKPVSKFAFKFNLYRLRNGNNVHQNSGTNSSKESVGDRFVVGQYKLNQVYSQLESAWFQRKR
jgi:hypothetical protein